MLAAHLAGRHTLALSSTDARGRSKWACLDIDTETPEALPRLLDLRTALVAQGLPGVVEASRRVGTCGCCSTGLCSQRCCTGSIWRLCAMWRPQAARSHPLSSIPT